MLSIMYDIKKLKLKFRPEEEKKYNSPWNVAVDFRVDMSFSADEIATMLREYEMDHHTGMNISEISREISFYTNGYPFLVSCLCKWMDESEKSTWTAESVRNAVRELLKTKNTLFDDLIKNIENDTELKNLIISILYDGISLPFNRANQMIDRGVMFGILTEKKGQIEISNLIFETYLYDYVITEKSIKEQLYITEKNQFVRDGKLDMERVLLKFQELMREEYRAEDEHFIASKLDNPY